MRRHWEAALVVSIAAGAIAGPPDRFDGYFAKMTASGYRNCGRASIGGANRSAVDTCVLKAFADGAPFFARYDQQGIDSNVATGLVFSRPKVLTIIQFDDYSCSTPHCARPESCNSPQITKTKMGLHVQCTNHYDL
jgi:hypothetical protein